MMQRIPRLHISSYHVHFFLRRPTDELWFEKYQRFICISPAPSCLMLVTHTEHSGFGRRLFTVLLCTGAAFFLRACGTRW